MILRFRVVGDRTSRFRAHLKSLEAKVSGSGVEGLYRAVGVQDSGV